MSVKIITFDLMQEGKEEIHKVLVERLKKLKAQKFSDFAYAVYTEMCSEDLCDHLSEGLITEDYIFVGELSGEIGCQAPNKINTWLKKHIDKAHERRESLKWQFISLPTSGVIMAVPNHYSSYKPSPHRVVLMWGEE